MVTAMTELETPLVLVRKWARMLPRCYELLDNIAHNPDYHEWPDCCDVPIAAANAVLTEAGNLTQQQAAQLGAELTACYTWRKNKIIYDFDETLARELCDQAKSYKNEDNLPVEILLHPPYPCVFIRCPGILDEYISGFFAWIEWDTNRNIPEFRASLMTWDYKHTFPLMLELPAPTLAECIASTTSETARHAGRPLPIPSPSEIQFLLSALNMYLYICSADADIQKNPEQSKIHRPRTPGAPIRDKFREIDVRDVGIVIGAALRKSRATPSNAAERKPSGERKPTRPHTRRGHWHHYWTGPKAKPGERKLVLKWTHPVLVGGANGDVITVRPVKGD